MLTSSSSWRRREEKRRTLASPLYTLVCRSWRNVKRPLQLSFPFPLLRNSPVLVGTVSESDTGTFPPKQINTFARFAQFDSPELLVTLGQSISLLIFCENKYVSFSTKPESAGKTPSSFFPLLPLFCGGSSPVSSLHNSRRKRKKIRRADKTTAAGKKTWTSDSASSRPLPFHAQSKGDFSCVQFFFFSRMWSGYTGCVFFLPPLSCQTFAAAAAFLLCVGHSAPHIVGAQVYSRIRPRPHALLEKEREKEKNSYAHVTNS